MSQPKHRRRAGRRRAQQRRTGYPDTVIHVLVTGEKRNPIGALAPLDMAIFCYGDAVVMLDGREYIDANAYAERTARKRRRSIVDRSSNVTPRTIERHIRRMRLGRRAWRIEMSAPLWEARWERKRPGKWVCVHHGQGFA